MDKLPWWKLEHKTRHPQTNKDTLVYLGDGRYENLPKGTFISPVRKAHLPYGHWMLERYNETVSVAADTPAGFGTLSLVDIDW